MIDKNAYWSDEAQDYVDLPGLLTQDECDALGLPTDGSDPRFPFTQSDLTDHEWDLLNRHRELPHDDYVVRYPD